MNQVTKITKIAFVSSASLFLAGNLFTIAYAQTTNTATSSASVSDDQDNLSANQALADSKKETRTDLRIAKLKIAGDKLVAVRLVSLNRLLNLVNKTQRVDLADKQLLVADINSNIDDLTALKKKINADTDLTTLKADIHSIFTTYRIYLVVLPRDYGLLLTYRTAFLTKKMVDLETTISTKITQAQNQGLDTTVLEGAFADYKAQLVLAGKNLDQAKADFSSMTPANTTKAQTSKEAGKLAVKDAIGQLKEAKDDLEKINQGLKNLKKKTASNSSTP